MKNHIPLKVLPADNSKRHHVAHWLLVVAISGIADSAACSDPISSTPPPARSMNVETTTEQLLFTTLRVETYGDGKTGVGTGFFFNHALSDSQLVPFIVTNKHVVEGWKNGALTFHTSQGGKFQLGKPFRIQINSFDQMWFMHPDPAVDVAIAPVAFLFREATKSKIELFYRGIDQSLIPTPADFEQLDALEEVVFIGYPVPIWDMVNFLPVIRRGSTATPIRIDYQGKKQFLIDASVFPGSSGSPVFLLNLGIHHDRKGNVIVGNRIKFLGIVSGVYIQQELNRIVIAPTPTADSTAAVSQRMINLGIVHKASTVDETIRAFLTAKGIVSNPTAIPVPAVTGK